MGVIKSKFARIVSSDPNMFNITRKTPLLITLFMLSVIVYGQHEQYKNIKLQAPVDIPIYLSGTFGELRNNHFHSGLDIKTQGVEGLNIYASDDGYVSRIKVSPNGYGKVLYVTHPGGLVTVYGHLQRFNKQIQQFVVKKQYEKKSFDIHLFPGKDELKVRKGEVVGYSGSTGGSSGPHLHYEIREESSQHPINPLFFSGIEIKDTHRPKILEVVIYPVDDKALINGKNDTAYYMVSGSGLQHYLDLKKEITVSGRISFGIRAYDPMNDIGNKNGVYQVQMYLDSNHIFGIEMDKLSFATTRYMNSLIDYGYYKKKRRRVIRTQVDTNNRLFNYRDISSNGIITFADEGKHNVVFEVSDVFRNTSKLKFDVMSLPEEGMIVNSDVNQEKGTFFSFREENDFSAVDIDLKFPVNAFYRSFHFQFDTLGRDSSMYSNLFKVHDRFTPIQKHFEIRIRPEGYNKNLKDKLFIALVNHAGYWYMGSEWEGDQIKVRSRTFGNYAIMADTVAPKIKPVNIYNKKRLKGQQTIKVTIEDKETGIGKFRGTLNGKWILMEYDPKQNLLTYNKDGRMLRGENNFRLEVEDMLGNKSVYESVIIN